MCSSAICAGTIIDCSPSASQGGATAPSPFPFGMRNAATYASSSSTNFTEYENLPVSGATIRDTLIGVLRPLSKTQTNTC